MPHLCVCLCGTSSSTIALSLADQAVCDMSLRAALIMVYISTLPRPDYSPAEPKSTARVSFLACLCEMERKTETEVKV